MSFCARLDRADQMATLVECLLMQNSDDAVHVVVDAANVEFHVLGRSKTTRARLTFPSGCFQAYEARDEHDNEFVDGADQEALALSLDGGGLVDCLRILGDCDVSLSYAQRDEIVKLTLEEPGAFTACDLCALDAGDDEDLFQDDLRDAFAASSPACTLLAASAALRDVVQDLDESAVAAQYIRLSVGRQRARFSARGSTGTVEIDVPRATPLCSSSRLPGEPAGSTGRARSSTPCAPCPTRARRACASRPRASWACSTLLIRIAARTRSSLEHMVCALEEEEPDLEGGRRGGRRPSVIDRRSRRRPSDVRDAR